MLLRDVVASFFFSSRRRHTRCALVTGVQTWARPICMSVDRQCASGLMAIATAAKEIIDDRMNITIGGGVESISLVQTPQMRVAPDPELLAMHSDIYMTMLKTAEVVAKRYNIRREVMDESAPPSDTRTNTEARIAGKRWGR